MRSAVVLNPSKIINQDAQREAITSALAEAGCPAPLWFETTIEDPGLGQTRAAVEAGVDVVIACGGDGTVRACAEGLAGTDAALAIIPTGTGNLLVTNLELPTEPADVVALAASGQRRRLDLGELDGQPFTVMAGMGFDAAMMEATPERWKRRIGWPAYVVGGLRRLRGRRMYLTITLDGGPPRRRRARSIPIANVGRLQGGIQLFDDAQPDDGVLDVAVVTPRSLGDWAALAATVLRRRARSRPHLETYRAKQVEVRAAGVEPRELDGETIEPAEHLSVSIRPAALWVCAPTNPDGR
jgi:diacylglycerol kinase family enzyme